MNSMNYIGKFISNFRDFYNEINAATLTGAIDVIVIEQPDGSFNCSPFHVRFGKLGVLRSREKIVDIEINGEPLDIHMKLGDSGEAFFVEEVSPDEDGGEEIPPHLACSPIPSHGDFDKWMKEKSSADKDYFRWDDKVVNSNDGDGSDPVVKMFVAETINNNTEDLERVRKLSVAGGEFKTIEKEDELNNNEVNEEKVLHNDKNENQSESCKEDKANMSSNSSSTSLNQLQTTPSTTLVTNTGGNNKRKRKKKKKSATALSSNTPSELNVAAEKTNLVCVTDVTQIEEGKCQQIEEQETQEDNKASCESLNELATLPLTNESDFHFFSDTEVTPGCSPESRPGSPVSSDTELEQQRHEETVTNASVMSQSWKWGELPSPIVRTQQVSSSGKAEEEELRQFVKEKQDEAEVHKSMLSGMFSFMKKTKHLRHSGQQNEGIYLCDLNSDELDPEIAALYFPHSYRGEIKQGDRDNDVQREEDTESGNGPSIEHSPVSHSPHHLDDEHQRQLSPLYTLKSVDMSMSLCGHLNSDLTDELFNQFIVSYDDFVTNPMLIENSDLVVRLNNKYYNWRMACPLVMSLALYNRPLPQPVIDMLSNELMPTNQNKSKEPTKQNESTRTYSSWFYWRRSSDSRNKSVTPQTSVVEEEPVSVRKEEPQQKLTEAIEKAGGGLSESEVKEKVDLEEKEEGYVGSNSSEDSDGPSGRNERHSMKIPVERRIYQQLSSDNDRFRKTLRLTSDQIASLNLEDGVNEVVFSVTTAYQGTTRCKCHIYKWKYNDRIVISDIDGTITKSDVLGHILPIVGKDWAQSGVAQLFTKIKNNGYKLLYLSARAIGQARVTRDYLKSIKQGDLSLPDGPLLLNPTSLISAFHREVIEKKPEEFKISCLRDIAALFPPDVKPFYAGYGNRVNDVWAYRAVGIPIVRIFTINYKGELKHELTQTFQSSYSNMCHLVDEMFPPPPKQLPEDFSNFVFWRDPIPDLDPTEVEYLDNKPKQKV